MYTKLLKLLLVSLIFTGCEMINPEEDIPAYLQIDAITLEINDPEQGSASNQIIDAWVYVNEKFVGAYPLGAKFPILEEGPSTVSVYAGVKQNGMSEFRMRYPFYEAYRNTNVNLEPGIITKLSTKVNYVDGLTFLWEENFDAITNSMNSDTTKALLTRTTEDGKVFEGLGTGHIHLDATLNSFIVKAPPLNIPTKGVTTYLEIDYKTDVSLHVDVLSKNLQGQTITVPLIVIVPKVDASGNAVWNKMYVDITYAAGQNATLNNDQFEIRVAASLPDGETQGDVYIDNLKLIHV